MKPQVIEQILMSEDEMKNPTDLAKLKIIDANDKTIMEANEEDDDEKKRKLKTYVDRDIPHEKRDGYKQVRKAEKYRDSNTAEFMERVYSQNVKPDQPIYRALENLPKEIKKNDMPSYSNAAKTGLAENHAIEMHNHHATHGYAQAQQDLHTHASYSHDHANHDHALANHKNESTSDAPGYSHSSGKHGGSCGCGSCYTGPPGERGGQNAILTGIRLLKK
jgi:hypothetical protein